MMTLAVFYRQFFVHLVLSCNLLNTNHFYTNLSLLFILFLS